MKKIITSALLAIFVLTGSAVQAQDTNQKVNSWPDTSHEVAHKMIKKYGEPTQQTEDMLIWKNTGPYTHTIVYKEEIQHDFPMPHKDVLEQVINYDVPVENFSDLARYDGSVIVERTKGTMAARCDKEAANFLALNLAHDIIKGKRSVEEARNMYAETIMKMMQGEEHQYLKELAFDVPKSNINNPDKTIMDMSKVKMMKEKMKDKKNK